MTIALTGHRPNKLNYEYDYRGPMSMAIRKALKEQIDLYQPDQIITGMALGADMLWAMVAREMKIPYIAAVPFAGQETMWPQTSQALYRTVLADAAKVVIVCEGGYAAWKMQKRNEWMVDNCDLLLAIWDNSSGGTANCVQYALIKNKAMIQLKPQDVLEAYGGKHV